MAASTRTRRKATAPEPVVEDDAFEELEEIDETEDEVEEAPAPKTRGRKAAPPTKTEAPANAATEYGSAWLAEHVTEVTGTEYDGRGIRMLLRKIAKDPEGPLGREIGEDRTRYTFRGPNDPVVKAVVRMVKTGADKAVKREGLEKVKATTPPKRTRAKAEDVEETTPTRTRARKTTAKAAAPAKATPTRRTRTRT